MLVASTRLKDELGSMRSIRNSSCSSIPVLYDYEAHAFTVLCLSPQAMWLVIRTCLQQCARIRDMYVTVPLFGICTRSHALAGGHTTVSLAIALAVAKHTLRHCERFDQSGQASKQASASTSVAGSSEEPKTHKRMTYVRERSKLDPPTFPLSRCRRPRGGHLLGGAYYRLLFLSPF